MCCDDIQVPKITQKSLDLYVIGVCFFTHLHVFISVHCDDTDNMEYNSLQLFFHRDTINMFE